MNSVEVEKTFDPFSTCNKSEENNNIFSYDAYENIRVSCSFHLPNKLKDVIAHNSNEFNIMHLNARSIVKNFDDLCTLMTETKVDWHAIAISETWLSKNIEDRHNIPGFRSYFCSRGTGTGGGSALYIKEHLHQKQLVVPIFTTAEVVCTSTTFTNNSSIIVCQIYKSPNTDKSQFIHELEQCLIHLSKLNRTTLIAGDFNFDLFSLDSSLPVQMFFNTLLSHGFFPTISKTTRSAHPSYTLLDNIFCNELSRVVHSGVLWNDLSDHFPIFSSLSSDMSCSENKTQKSTIKQVFDYNRIDEFKCFLSESLKDIHSEHNPDIIANKIILAYNEGMDNFSYRKTLSRKNDPRKPWITPAIMLSIAHKNELFRDKTKHPLPHKVAKYNQYRNMLTNVLRSAKKKFYQGEFTKHAANPKETWKTLQTLIKSKRKNEDTPSLIIDEDDGLVIKDEDIAEKFNMFFTEIGEKLCKNIRPSSLDPLQFIPNFAEEMLLGTTNERELVNIIKELNDVGPGVDNISSKIFKASYRAIMKPLLHLFNTCLESGTFPNSLKIAVVKPIFKSGDCQLINNYRPISILPYISKVLEKLIHHRLMEHLDRHKIIHQNQFGFQKNKSTYMPILLLQDMITKAFEDGDLALGLYLDIKKAFDTVNIDILLKKLYKYGIRHRSHEILSSYLSGRKQCVKIRNAFSSYKDVTMGVPQGSILGPVLFILYINDLPNLSADMTCLSYADDTAILFKGKSSDQLQVTVNEVVMLLNDWFRANFLSLNISKTYTQHYTTRSVDFKLDVKLNDIRVVENNHIKYLGVVLDKSLKFTKHIEHISAIVGRNIGIISRIRYCIDKRTAHLLYNSLVLPHLNYCCMIWGSNYYSQLERLIILQKRAVRLIEHVYPPHSSEPIFKQYNILKLDDIAKSQMLLVMHKFINNQLPPIFENIFKLCDTHSSVARRVKHLQQPFSNRNYRLFTTSCLGPKLWNNIVAAQFPCLGDVPTSKTFFKNIIRKHFVQTYYA